MTAAAMAYSTVGMGLRSPRAIVVFDGGDGWTYRVRHALHLAGQVWGGCGFALVPHRNGEVDSTLLRACRAFDPDYVVVAHLTVGELEYMRPGEIMPPTLPEGDRMRWLEDYKDDLVSAAPEDMAARDRVAGVCSPYRTKRDGESWDEDVQILERGGRGFHDALSMEGIFPGSDQVLSGTMHSVLTCPPSWGGVLGALTASYAGVVDPPDVTAREPDLNEDKRAQLTSWLLDTPGASAPEELLWTPNEGTPITLEPTPLSHIRSMAGLVPVTRATSRRGTGLLVEGDEPEDFALARLWHLTFGFGQWLPSALGVDQDELPAHLTSAMSHMALRYRSGASKLVLTSISRPTTHVTRVHENLQKLPGWRLGSGRDISTAVAAADLDWNQPSHTRFGVAEQFDSYVTVPTVVDETGTRSMAAPLPPPTINTRALVQPAELTWHVDIGWRPAQMVLGRGLDGQEVFTHDTPEGLTWGRSSRNGISYQSHRFDFVAAGIPEVNKLARPSVRDLSLAAWIEAKGREHGFHTRPGPAGHRASQLTRMLGGRRQFVNLFTGHLRDALRDLHPTESTTSKAYPQHDGLRLAAGEGVLTFAGFVNRVSLLEDDELRDELDSVLRSGVLRRGLVLRCGTCEMLQFQPVGNLGQTWTCTRCDAHTDLSRSAWRKPVQEPLWYYDLHPVARHLLRDHGDVPALLSAHFERKVFPPNAAFQDVSELEFVEDGKPRVEADLITYCDDTLTIAECKSNDHLATSKTEERADVTKKCQVAAWLQADQLVFATTSPKWSTSTPGLVRAAAAEFPWGPLGPPEVRLIAGLGTDTVTSDTLPIPGQIEP